MDKPALTYHLDELQQHLNLLTEEGYGGDFQDMCEELYGEHQQWCEELNLTPQQQLRLISYSAGVALGELQPLMP